MKLLLSLHKTLPNLSTGKPDNVAGVLLVGACFNDEANPWVTSNSHEAVSFFINSWTPSTSDDNTFWCAIESILRDTIRPLFADTKNPAITSAGRKNLHPQTLPRFGSTGLDEPKKPWKTTDIYVASVLSWILSQYSVCYVEPTWLFNHTANLNSGRQRRNLKHTSCFSCHLYWQ